MNVKNIMEDIVFTKLNEMIDDLGVCTCEQCKSDIAACTLNHIPPKYYSSEKGGLFIKLGQITADKEVEVIQQIVRAAEIVKEHPRHDNN